MDGGNSGLYDLLFTSAAHALQAVANQPRHLGAELGMIGVLHTWGRQLQLHLHVHLIVPGGGLRSDDRTWRKSRSPEWFLPVKAIAAAFLLGFAEALRAHAPDLHAQAPDSTWRRDWVVHCQPAGSGEPVVRYLARYVARTAISDERIVAADNHAVTFRYRDSHDGEERLCTLGADDVARQRGDGAARGEAEGEWSGCPRSGRRDEQFLRRYLQHVLPPGLHRVRYPPKAGKLWLAASGRQGSSHDRGYAARRRHRRAAQGGRPAGVASVLPALPRLQPALRAHPPALAAGPGPMTPRLLPLSILFPPPPNPAPGRSLVHVASKPSIQRPTRLPTKPPTRSAAVRRVRPERRSLLRT
ncbi:MAG TPA: transposase [Opitutaceae bacterium]